MRINNNISALNAWRNLYTNDSALTKSMEKLSSGFRINRAADDAAGLAISEKMRGQIRGLNQAVRNAQDGISLIQTAEGALNESHAILQRMEELAVQAANDTNTPSDRFEIQREINALTEELTRIAQTTEFNTMTLLDGTFGATFHIGANANQTISVAMNDMAASALSLLSTGAVSTFDPGSTNLVASASDGNVLVGGSYRAVVTTGGGVSLYASDGTVIGSGTIANDATAVTITVSAAYLAGTGTDITLALSDIDTAATIATLAGTIAINVLEAGQGFSVMDQGDAETAIVSVQSALGQISAQRSALGAVQNRLEHTINNLQVAAENLTASESRIRDVDMAAEMTSFVRNQILLQAGTAMLAQANAKPQSVLQLLG